MQGSNSILDYLSDEMKQEYCKYMDCHQNGDQVVNCAMQVYIHHLKRKQRIQALKSGYEQMAQINLGFAQSGFVKDVTTLNSYECILRGEE